MEVAILAIIFGTIFGIFYLYLSTRNKERLALIEKGADASIFNSSNKAGSSWKVIVLNFAFLLMGVGSGVLIALILTNILNVTDDGPVYIGSIFLTAGIGLYLGFIQTRKALD